MLTFHPTYLFLVSHPSSINISWYLGFGWSNNPNLIYIKITILGLGRRGNCKNLYQFSFKCLILIGLFWYKHASVPLLLPQFEDVRIHKFTHLVMDLLCSQGNVISCEKLLVFVIVYSTVLDGADFVDLWLGLKFKSGFCLLKVYGTKLT